MARADEQIPSGLTARVYLETLKQIPNNLLTCLESKKREYKPWPKLDLDLIAANNY